MRRLSFAISIVLAAGSAGCCCCHQGFSLHGDWSVQMDPLPADCGHGGCACSGGLAGPDGHGHGHPIGAVPTTSPRFHPLPVAPVGNVMAPTPAPFSDGQVMELPVAPPSNELAAAEESSSWMFVERPVPQNRAGLDAAHRRQLTAETWSGARRR